MIGGWGLAGISEKSSDQLLGLAERDEMTAGYFVRGDAEAVVGNPLLELSRKESVVAGNKNAGRDRRPGCDGAAGSEDRI